MNPDAGQATPPPAQARGARSSGSLMAGSHLRRHRLPGAHRRDDRLEGPAGHEPVDDHADPEGRVLSREGRRHPERHRGVLLSGLRRHASWPSCSASRSSSTSTSMPGRHRAWPPHPLFVRCAVGHSLHRLRRLRLHPDDGSFGLRTSLLAGIMAGGAPRVPDHEPGGRRGRADGAAGAASRPRFRSGATRLETALKVVDPAVPARTPDRGPDRLRPGHRGRRLGSLHGGVHRPSSLPRSSSRRRPCRWRSSSSWVRLSPKSSREPTLRRPC